MKTFRELIGESQLQEISANTLRSYSAKAKQDIADRSATIGAAEKKAGRKNATMATMNAAHNTIAGEKDKIAKRKAGLSKAEPKIDADNMKRIANHYKEKAELAGKAANAVKSSFDPARHEHVHNHHDLMREHHHLMSQSAEWAGDMAGALHHSRQATNHAIQAKIAANRYHEDRISALHNASSLSSDSSYKY